MTENALDLAHTVMDTLDEKKGENILLLDLIGVCSFTDYFVLCSGTSQRMLRALSDEVQDSLKKKFSIRAKRIEGKSGAGWTLIDYGDLVVHLFSPDMREYYDLEDLWKEGKVLLHMQ
jgi:ribosome-associated protein